MICQFKRLIYPKTIAAAESNYTIALYHPCEKIKDAAGNLISEVKAVGYCLPTADNLRYEMKGRWSRNAKHGVQFEVEGYSEVIIPTKEGIIAYLCSGQIKGIGPKTAEKIYAAFGVKTLDVLDTEPEKLLSISGISQNKLSKICDSYLASRGARDVVAFLAPHGVTPNRAVKLYKQYGEQTMDIVRNHPYRLCEMVGIGFKTADRIAMSMGFDRLSPERVDEGMLFTLVDAELKGHLCMEKHSFIKQCPCCDDSPRKKHLNINLQKDVFRCPRCGFSGGVFDLYAQYAGIPRDTVRDALIARLDVRGEIPKPTVPLAPVIQEYPPTDIDARHATYTALLSRLSLASDHLENLLSRGLSPEEIQRLEYRTTPVVGMKAISKRLLSDGFYLAGVPGFYRRDDQWTFISESRGILIPVRDMDGRIQGLQIRRDNVSRRKFRWVSSIGKDDGCKAEGWVHVAGTSRASVILIEGPMKADIIHYLTGQTVIAVAGVNTLSQLEPVLERLRECGAEKIMTAFDMDFMANPHVRSGYENLMRILDDNRFRYGTYVWDPQYNGLDDYVWKYCINGHASQ